MHLLNYNLIHLSFINSKHQCDFHCVPSAGVLYNLLMCALTVQCTTYSATLHDLCYRYWYLATLSCQTLSYSMFYDLFTTILCRYVYLIFLYYVTVLFRLSQYCSIVSLAIQFSFYDFYHSSDLVYTNYSSDDLIGHRNIGPSSTHIAYLKHLAEGNSRKIHGLGGSKIERKMQDVP